MLAIMLAARRWAPWWANHRVIIHSDNQAAVQIINKGTTASELIMDELHNLFWLSAAYNFHISAIYIEGVRNTIADAISRLHDPRHLHNFYALLRDHLPRIAVDQLRLNDHMLVHSSSFVFSRCTFVFSCPHVKASSVRSYLNIIGILHKEFGLPNPLLNNWPLKSLLTGINRSKGLQTKNNP